METTPPRGLAKERSAILLPLFLRIHLPALRVRTVVDANHNIRIRCSNSGVNLAPLAGLKVFLEQDGVVSTDPSHSPLPLEPLVPIQAPEFGESELEGDPHSLHILTEIFDMPCLVPLLSAFATYL